MREIKFRAWDKERNKMLKPGCIYAIDFYGHPLRLYAGGEHEAKDDWVLMQYTGLKDKNGVEIYEGDIVHLEYEDISCLKIKEAVGQIEYHQDECQFIIKEKEDWFNLGILSDKESIEVIGNIYANPELLEVK